MLEGGRKHYGVNTTLYMLGVHPTTLRFWVLGGEVNAVHIGSCEDISGVVPDIIDADREVLGLQDAEISCRIGDRRFLIY